MSSLNPSSSSYPEAVDEEQCSTRLSCARAQSSKQGALYERAGTVGASCFHNVPLAGSFCDLRGPENCLYYMVSRCVLYI